MTDRDQIEAFAQELDNLIERFEHEFELPNVAAVGVMQLKIHAMLSRQLEEGGD